MIEIINTFKIEIFLTILGGILIFVIQKLISEIWLYPNFEFQKCLARIETLIIRSYSLYKFEYKNESNKNWTSSKGTSMDLEIEGIRKELNVATFELIGAFNILFVLEKWWLKAKGIDACRAKPALLTLSVAICSKGSWSLDANGSFKIEAQMDRVCNLLKFKHNRKAWDKVY
ncbi:MAG: hypothetical protein PHW33_01075 [Candidatus Portnoybacteria bacterium]|jgi:hypothetical protein|nr:hypothetical protein [Candidatus Portnoybacteria bacterium]